jgi:hypothetical protein
METSSSCKTFSNSHSFVDEHVSFEGFIQLNLFSFLKNDKKYNFLATK